MKGKGAKERIAILSTRLIIAIKEYLEKASMIDLEKKLRARDTSTEGLSWHK